MNRKKILITRFVPLLIILALAVVLFASSVFAYYVVNSQVQNDFTPAQSGNPVVAENMSVTVEDMGYPVFVRVVILVTWQDNEDDEKDVYDLQPTEGVDYELTLNLDDWEPRSNGYITYYYYTKEPVEGGGTTGVLIEKCEAKSKAPDERYSLNVELIVQTVQAVGETDDDQYLAWQDAWGIKD